MAAGMALLLAACSAATPVAPTAIPLTNTPTMPLPTPTISPADCQACHQDVFSNWRNGSHANTQTDVAKELGEARSGQTPNDVLNGPDAED